MRMMYVCHAESNPYAVDTLDYARKFLESLSMGPMIPLPIMLWLVGIFELFDLILLLHAQDDRSVDQPRRHLHLILPLRLIRMFGILLCFGLILQRGCHVLLAEQLPCLHSSEYSKAKTKQKNLQKDSKHYLTHFVLCSKPLPVFDSQPNKLRRFHYILLEMAIVCGELLLNLTT